MPGTKNRTKGNVKVMILCESSFYFCQFRAFTRTVNRLQTKSSELDVGTFGTVRLSLIIF